MRADGSRREGDPPTPTAAGPLQAAEPASPAGVGGGGGGAGAVKRCARWSAAGATLAAPTAAAAARGGDEGPVGGGLLRPGAQVRLCALRASPELNGVEATVTRWEASVGRWVVRLLGSGQAKRLKAENLEALATSGCVAAVAAASKALAAEAPAEAKTSELSPPPRPPTLLAQDTKAVASGAKPAVAGGTLWGAAPVEADVAFEGAITEPSGYVSAGKRGPGAASDELVAATPAPSLALATAPAPVVLLLLLLLVVLLLVLLLLLTTAPGAGGHGLARHAGRRDGARRRRACS